MRESSHSERRKGNTEQESRKSTIYHESMTTTSKRSAPLKNTCLHSLTRNCCSNAIDHHVPNEHMNLSPKSRFDHLLTTDRASCEGQLVTRARRVKCSEARLSRQAESPHSILRSHKFQPMIAFTSRLSSSNSPEENQIG